MMISEGKTTGRAKSQDLRGRLAAARITTTVPTLLDFGWWGAWWKRGREGGREGLACPFSAYHRTRHRSTKVTAMKMGTTDDILHPPLPSPPSPGLLPPEAGKHCHFASAVIECTSTRRIVTPALSLLPNGRATKGDSRGQRSSSFPLCHWLVSQQPLLGAASI